MTKAHKYQFIEDIDARLWSMRAMHDRVWVLRSRTERNLDWQQLLRNSSNNLLLRFIAACVVGFIVLGQAINVFYSAAMNRNVYLILLDSVLLLFCIFGLRELIKLGFYMFVSNRSIEEYDRNPIDYVGTPKGKVHHEQR